MILGVFDLAFGCLQGCFSPIELVFDYSSTNIKYPFDKTSQREDI